MKKIVHNIDQARQVFKSIDWDKSWEISIKEFKAKRSLTQNALWHVWIGEITEHLNAARIPITEKTVKDLLKRQFGPKIEVFGEILDKPSSQYTFEEMTDMLIATQGWSASDLSLQLRAKGEFEMLREARA